MDKNVLIPRPETELLVDRALLSVLEHIKYFQNNINKKGSKKSVKDINILEIGTGSGAIAISIAYELEDFLTKKFCDKFNFNEIVKSFNWKILATDLSRTALQIADNNAKKLLDEKRYEKICFIYADILPGNEQSFINLYKNNIDIVVSNPPYISEHDYKYLPEEVKLFEPKEALVSGESGLEAYEKILACIFPFMNNDKCTLLFETDPKLAESLKNIVINSAEKNNFY